MYTVFVIGTAGAGKSTLVGALVDWLKTKGENAISVNLDPGVRFTPYSPDVDVRNYIVLEDIMDKYSLGPNGALIMASDLLALELGKINSEIEESKPDYVVIDTPGQLELFAFRECGPIIAREISGDKKVVIYLFDSVFSSNPLNFVSNMLLASAVYYRLLLPQVYILSKADLLSQKKVNEILNWAEDEQTLENAISTYLSGERVIMVRDLYNTLHSLSMFFELIPISAKTLDGFINLHAQLTRILTGGEENL